MYLNNQSDSLGLFLNAKRATSRKIPDVPTLGIAHQLPKLG